MRKRHYTTMQKVLRWLKSHTKKAKPVVKKPVVKPVTKKIIKDIK